jgi:hypothetical protein
MKKVIPYLTLIFASFHAQAADAEKWVKLDPAFVSCSFSAADGPYDSSAKISYDDNVLYHVKSSDRRSLENIAILCRAAREQAMDDRKSVYLNLNTGDMQPEDGFFVRETKVRKF